MNKLLTPSPQFSQNELSSIVRIPGNDFCADCGTKGPRWASVNLGILMCIDCSGVHRGMGTHISVVKSLTLDRWKETWILVVRSIGNTLGKAYYEYNVPNNVKRPNPQDPKTVIENWIRNKYEKKLYVPTNTFPPYYYVLRGENPNLSLPGNSQITTGKKKKGLMEKPISHHHNKTKQVRNSVNLLDDAEHDFKITTVASPLLKSATKHSSFHVSKHIKKDEETSSASHDILQQLSVVEFKNATANHLPSSSISFEEFHLTTAEAISKAKLDSAASSIDQLFSNKNKLFDFDTSFPIICPKEDPPFPLLTESNHSESNEALQQKKNDSDSTNLLPIDTNQKVCHEQYKDGFLNTFFESTKQPNHKVLTTPSSSSSSNDLIFFRTGFEENGNHFITNDASNHSNMFQFDFNKFEESKTSDANLEQNQHNTEPFYTSNSYNHAALPSLQQTSASYTGLFDFNNVFSNSSMNKSAEHSPMTTAMNTTCRTKSAESFSFEKLL